MKKKKVKLLDTGQRNITIAIIIPTAKERNRLHARKWKKDHPDRYQAHLEWVRQWRKKNRKKLLEYNQKWRDAHREEYRKQQRDYYWRKKKKLVNNSSKNTTKSIKLRGKNVHK